MYIRLVAGFSIFASIALGIYSIQAATKTDTIPMYAWLGCDGTAVTRTAVGKLEITHIAKNLPNCNGANNTPITSNKPSSLNMFDDSRIIVSNTGWHVAILHKTGSTLRPQVGKKILLDLAQTDIVNYRIELIRQEQIQYANAIRSVRIRQGKRMDSETEWYLIKNEAVQVTGEAGAWTPVRSGEVVVTDTRENTIDINTEWGTSGYTATRWLRDATPADLVKIWQADIAYWSDIVHTNVEYRVNVRSNPWFSSPIVTTLQNNVVLYRTATIDNWSQVQSADGSVKGYIKSSFLTVDVAQLIEKAPLLK